MRIRWWTAPGAIAAVALIAACGSSGSSGSSSSGSGSSSTPAASAPASSAAATVALPSPVSTSATGIKTATNAEGTFLVTAQGAPIYVFAADALNKSNCSAQCLSFWPALTGTPTAAAGVSLPGTFGTIKGTGGITQATYDGHPLYLFAADKSMNTPTGNGLKASGALWWDITPAGTDLPKAAAAAPAPAKSTAAASTGSGAGGYGY